MKLIEIVNGMDVIVKLMEKEVDFQLAYKLSKLFNKLGKETDFFNEKRKSIIEKYGTADKDGSYFIDQKSEDYKVALKELQELENVESELDIDLFSIEDLKTFKLTALDVMKINFLIQE